MCGIVAYSGKTNFNKDKINLLLYWNSIERGKDSTGIYSPLNNIKKTTDKASDFLNKIDFLEDNLFIGHVRSSTVGGNLIKNAHPFQFDNLIGVHNGTLTNHHTMATKAGMKFDEWDVDSQVIYYRIAKEKNYKVLNEFIGAAALVWADVTNNTLYCFRNSERPLFRGNLDDGIYISSIKESLEVIGCINVKEFKENNVYTIKDGKLDNCTIKIKRPIIIEDEYSNNRAGFTQNYKWWKNDDILDMWVQADRNFYVSWGQSCNVSKDNFYFVEDVAPNNSWGIIIKDDDNKSVCADISNFNKYSFQIGVNDYVLTLDDCKNSKGEVIIVKDQVLLVEERFHDNRADCTCLKVSTAVSSHIIKLSSVRKATRSELYDIKKDLEKLDEESGSKEIGSVNNIEDIEKPITSTVGEYPVNPVITNRNEESDIEVIDDEEEYFDVDYDTVVELIGEFQDGISLLQSDIQACLGKYNYINGDDAKELLEKLETFKNITNERYEEIKEQCSEKDDVQEASISD